MDVPTSADDLSPRTPTGGTPSRWSYSRWGCVSSLATLVVLGVLLYPMLQTAREAARRSTCKENLFFLRFALQNYHEYYGCFPPPYVADADGRPMHSWRVLILPFVDQPSLYKEYRFDEPWDGPNNRKLAGRIAQSTLFRCDSDESQSGTSDRLMTNYLAVVGSGTAWEEGKCTTLRDITDGPETTLMLVEVVDSGIHWMEPRDLHIYQMAPTINPKAGQGISSRHPGGAHGATVDRSCRFLSEKLSATTIRGLLTIRGGERISEGDF